jgi:hypothetical protein
MNDITDVLDWLNILGNDMQKERSTGINFDHDHWLGWLQMPCRSTCIALRPLRDESNRGCFILTWFMIPSEDVPCGMSVKVVLKKSIVAPLSSLSVTMELLGVAFRKEIQDRIAHKRKTWLRSGWRGQLFRNDTQCSVNPLQKWKGSSCSHINKKSHYH